MSKESIPCKNRMCIINRKKLHNHCQYFTGNLEAQLRCKCYSKIEVKNER